MARSYLKITQKFFSKDFQSSVKKLDFLGFFGQEQAVPPESISKIGLFNPQRHETTIPHRPGTLTVRFTRARSLYNYHIHVCLFFKKNIKLCLRGFLYSFLYLFLKLYYSL